MPLVYASDVKHDGEYVKKRGDRFAAKDAKDLFGLDDDGADQLVEDGIVVMDTALPENVEEGRSSSYYEMQAEMLRKYEETGDQPEDSLAGTIAKEPLKAQAVQTKADKEKAAESKNS